MSRPPACWLSTCKRPALLFNDGRSNHDAERGGALQERGLDADARSEPRNKRRHEDDEDDRTPNQQPADPPGPAGVSMQRLEVLRT